RLVTKSDTIDSTTLNQTFVYDSQDRVISEHALGNEVDYVYDRQGLVKNIPGYITASTHDAYGSITGRTSANGLVTTLAYNTANHRLNSIQIPSVQNLTY